MTEWTPKELREALRDANLPALEHSGLISEDELDLLLSCRQHHPRGDESQLYERILERATSHRIRESVEKGHGASMAHAVGLSNQRDSLYGFRTLEALEEFWEDYPTFSVYLYGPLPPEGPVGVGKTDFAYLLSEVGRRVYDDLKVASNTPSDEFETFQSWTGVEQWLQEADGRKLFILDEAAQVLQFADMKAGKVVSKFLKLIRKYEGNIIMIGHTGRDVPKDIRRQLLVVRKDTKQTATVGVGLEETSEGIEPDDVLLDLTDIPKTNINYDTLDTADFSFDVDDFNRGRGASSAGGEEEVVECSAEGCSASSVQYSEITETGYCPFHGSDGADGDGESVTPRARGRTGVGGHTQGYGVSPLHLLAVERLRNQTHK